MSKIWTILAGIVALSAAAAGLVPGSIAAAPALSLAQAQAGGETPTIQPDDRILGKADAPITIFEYASLTCPHCAAFDKETLPTIEKDWIDAGKAKLVYRDFPLDGAALKAAVLARCAPPDKFYGLIDVLFKSQLAWAARDPTAGLERIAKLAGMSDEQFKSCMANKDIENKVLAERLTAEKAYKVESTPTFFINGKRIVGAQPYDVFAEALKHAAKA